MSDSIIHVRSSVDHLSDVATVGYYPGRAFSVNVCLPDPNGVMLAPSEARNLAAALVAAAEHCEPAAIPMPPARNEVSYGAM